MGTYLYLNLEFSSKGNKRTFGLFQNSSGHTFIYLTKQDFDNLGNQSEK